METFDYIVVGAGSSGCVVASRLSEQRDAAVLLIEAGGVAKNFWISTPIGTGKIFRDGRFNWSYQTKSVATLGGREIYWPRGKVLGGSSAINGMVYMRGHPLDFDHWASLGNAGWGWDDVLPYFNRSESSSRRTPHRGADGPLAVTETSLRHPTTDDFISSAMRQGMSHISDFNSPPFEGVGYREFTIRRGRRHSSYDAFIAPVRHRPNLTVRTGLQVTRVVFEGRQAVGVEVVEGGARRVIRAAREVILSGGALNSPHLLMHSGIGDEAQLRRFGIETLQHAPGVGQNLMDHWFAPFLLRGKPGSSYNRDLQGLRKYLHGAWYLLTGRGYLALGAAPAGAYARSEPEQTQPDLQLALWPINYSFSPSGGAMIDKLPGMSAAVVLVRPKSRGHLELTSPDPLVGPEFHPNYLGDPDDIRRTLIGMRLLRKILATEPLASRIVAEMLPGSAATSDEQLTAHLKANGSTGWHQVGTCKMGNDDMAVVDARLRVRGVERLRVIDASIMPRITSGNTNAPAIMIGEKGADMIRQDAAALPA